jgi:hypothetical protein
VWFARVRTTCVQGHIRHMTREAVQRVWASEETTPHLKLFREVTKLSDQIQRPIHSFLCGQTADQEGEEGNHNRIKVNRGDTNSTHRYHRRNQIVFARVAHTCTHINRKEKKENKRDIGVVIQIHTQKKTNKKTDRRKKIHPSINLPIHTHTCTSSSLQPPPLTHTHTHTHTHHHTNTHLFTLIRIQTQHTHNKRVHTYTHTHTHPHTSIV